MTAPTENQWQSDIVKLQIGIRARCIEQLSEKIEHTIDYPSETPLRLCQLIKITAHVLSKTPEVIPPHLHSQATEFLNGIAEHLRYVERARTEQTPWSMIQTAEAFLQKLFKDKCHFIIRPQWHYNYSILGDFVNFYSISIEALSSTLLSRWKEAIGDRYSEKIYCLSFPRVDRLNCLLHANWGHEVGHIIANQWLQDFFNKLWSNHELAIRDKIDSRLRSEDMGISLLPELFREQAIQQCVADKADTVMNVVKQGLTELLCDSIGLYLLGPAFLASQCYFSAPFSLDENPLDCENYPPWRFRIRNLVQDCEDLQNHENYPSEIIRPFFEWLTVAKQLVNAESDLPILNMSIETQIAYQFINDNWKSVKAQALSLLPQGREHYRLWKVTQNIEELVGKLCNDIPPTELGDYPNTKPARFEDILNAAWVFLVGQIRRDPAWATSDRFEKLFRLVLKAIESSFVYETFGSKLSQLK